jgi:hypothetical protein
MPTLPPAAVGSPAKSDGVGLHHLQRDRLLPVGLGDIEDTIRGELGIPYEIAAAPRGNATWQKWSRAERTGCRPEGTAARSAATSAAVLCFGLAFFRLLGRRVGHDWDVSTPIRVGVVPSAGPA